MVNKEEVLEAHRKNKGKIEMIGKVPLKTKEDLSTYYTPGVAYACLAIKENKDSVYDYTLKGRTIAIVTDGTRILGLGNIGAEAGMPVMEGKALLMKKYGGFDAVPICLGTTDEGKIVEIVKALAPSFGAINIEDIETPKCFAIFDRLKNELDIPVFHDDRNGVAAVTLAGIYNSLKLVGKKLGDVKIVINGAGAAGVGIAEILVYAGVKKVYLADRSGLIYKGRTENMNRIKEMMAGLTNKELLKGNLESAVNGADILIGASSKGAFTKEMIRSMAEKPIVFALANPEPEIDYNDALDAGAVIVATGRSDTPNQINNLSAFPGILKGMLEARAKGIDNYVLVAAAKAIAKVVGNRLSNDYIMPDITDDRIASRLAANVASEVVKAISKQGLARVDVDVKKVDNEVRESLKRYRKLERFISKQK